MKNYIIPIVLLMFAVSMANASFAGNIITSNTAVDPAQYQSLIVTINNSLVGADNGIAPYTYNIVVYNALAGGTLIANSLTSSSAGQTTFTFKMPVTNGPGTFNAYVTVSDATSNTFTANAIFTEYPPITFSTIIISPNPATSGQAFHIIPISITGGNGNYGYNWYNGTCSVGNLLGSNTVTVDTPTQIVRTYCATASDGYYNSQSTSNTVTINIAYGATPTGGTGGYYIVPLQQSTTTMDSSQYINAQNLNPAIGTTTTVTHQDGEMTLLASINWQFAVEVVGVIALIGIAGATLLDMFKKG